MDEATGSKSTGEFSDNLRDSDSDSNSVPCVVTEKMARTTKETKVGKKRKSRTSKTEVLENRIEGLENRVDANFFKLFNMMNSKASRDTGDSVTQIPTDRQDNDPNGVRRPVLPLEPNLEEDLGSPRIVRATDFDARSEISLQVGSGEKRDFLGLCSDDDMESVGSKSPVSVQINTESTNTRKSDRFFKYLHIPDSTVKSTNQCNDINVDNSSSVNNVNSDNSNKNNYLCKLFSDDLQDKSESTSIGLVLDQAQIDILSHSWRSKNPERLTAFKDEYRVNFPIHENARDFLQVPTLDDLLEPMMKEMHGPKAVRAWASKNRQLHTQPLKPIEKLAYQGQMASRMGIISTLYTQQALGTLLSKVENESCSPETSQLVKDLFAMSTKTLDQIGRAGAFHHMIRRKASESDSGLNTLKDIQAKVLYLPLSHEGVFGKGLEDKLKARKEQKDQLDDLMPELGDGKRGNKRKSDMNRDNWGSNYKIPRTSHRSSDSRDFGNSKISYTRTPLRDQTPRNRDGLDKRDKFKKAEYNSGAAGGFRIPKKQNK